MQSRRYETANETFILSACAGLMQDLGFNLDESEPELGVIVGSKERSAVDASQETTAVLVAILFRMDMKTDKRQTMRCSVVTSPQGNAHMIVRVTFQRIVWNEDDECSKQEGIKDNDVYQEFFNRLSKAIFLEAQRI